MVVVSNIIKRLKQQQTSLTYRKNIVNASASGNDMYAMPGGGAPSIPTCARQPLNTGQLDGVSS